MARYKGWYGPKKKFGSRKAHLAAIAARAKKKKYKGWYGKKKKFGSRAAHVAMIKRKLGERGKVSAKYPTRPRAPERKKPGTVPIKYPTPVKEPKKYKYQ